MCVIHNSKAVEGSARQRESTCGPVAPLEARAAPFAGRPSSALARKRSRPSPHAPVCCHNVRASLFQLSSTSRAQCHLAGAELRFSQHPSSPWFLTPELARRAAVPRRMGLSLHLATCWCPSPCCPQVGSGRGQGARALPPLASAVGSPLRGEPPQRGAARARGASGATRVCVCSPDPRPSLCNPDSRPRLPVHLTPDAHLRGAYEIVIF